MTIQADAVLAKIDRATSFLAEANSLQELKTVIVMADAASMYAKRMKASKETLNYAGEIRIRAERKLGQTLKATPKHPGTRGQLRSSGPGRGNKTGGTKPEPPVLDVPTLAESGIDKKLSSSAQQLASVPEPEFEKAIQEAKKGELAPSKIRTDLARKGKEEKRESRRRTNREVIAKTASPDSAIKAGAKFSTIVIDPPWDWGDEGDADQLGRARPTYGTMSFDELKALKVGELADKDCHIYLWITNRSLPKGFALLDAWGFRYVTCLTWCKPSIGMGNYFRGSTEQILFGVKGSQPLKRKDVGTWFEAPRGRGGHSSKPTESYELIESCSPGPYIEMFARSNRDGWTAWGAEVK